LVELAVASAALAVISALGLALIHLAEKHLEEIRGEPLSAKSVEHVVCYTVEFVVIALTVLVLVLLLTLLLTFVAHEE